MNRRSFFGAMAGAGAAAVLPVAALANDIHVDIPPPSDATGLTVSTPVSHVYLARSWEICPTYAYGAYTKFWRETWRHSTDPTWVRTVIFSDLTPYEDRHRFMQNHYEQEWRVRDQQTH